MYVYVSKTEYDPARKEFEQIIRNVQDTLRAEEGITFQFVLVGSGGRHLVTRLVGGNRGFDLDYNLVLKSAAFGDDPEYIRNVFLKAFQNAVRETYLSVADNSTSSIAIEYISHITSKIIYSCDLAIVEYENDNKDEGYYINKRSNGKYIWEFRNNSVGIKRKLEELKEYNYKEFRVWIKGEYLKLKNSNKDLNKHSFTLYNEAVNNVYHHMQQEKRRKEEESLPIFNKHTFAQRELEQKYGKN